MSKGLVGGVVLAVGIGAAVIGAFACTRKNSGWLCWQLFNSPSREFQERFLTGVAYCSTDEKSYKIFYWY